MAYSNLRFCFDNDNGLTAVVPLDKEGACDTPAATWTTTEIPDLAADLSKVYFGMSQKDYLILCGYPAHIFRDGAD